MPRAIKQLESQDMEDGLPPIPESDESLPYFLKKGDPFATLETVETLVKKGLTSDPFWDRSGRIYASGSAYCARQTMLYSTFKGNSMITASSKAYMKLGEAIEELVISGLFNTGSLLFTQYRLPDVGLNMGGKIDAVIYVDGKIRVLEVKSCGELPARPKPEHRAQALMYNAVTGIPASILYFSRGVADYRGNLKLRNIPLNATPEELLAAMFVVCYSHFAIEMNVIPARPPEFDSEAQCGFCMYKENCWHGLAFKKPLVTPEQNRELTEKAGEMSSFLMSASQLTSRRTGVLNFIQVNGNEHANRVLNGTDWDALV